MTPDQPMKRRVRVSYSQDGCLKWATIETATGFYVCEVHRCSDEGRKRFRKRVRQIQQAIESYPRPMVTTSDEEF